MRMNLAAGRQLIADWETSGLSKRRFCEQNEIPLHRLYYWAERVRESEEIPSPQGFIAVSPEESAGAIEVHHPSGVLVRLRTKDEALVSSVIRAVCAC